METMDKIRGLHPGYEPAEEYRSAFLRSGFVAFTGQVAGAGKDSVKDKVAALCSGVSCPSLTDRGHRPSDGPLVNDSYIYVTPEEMLEEIEGKTLIEYQPLRNYSYATPGRIVKAMVDGGKRPFKDLEPNGLMKLRDIVGTEGIVRAVFPLPDLTTLDNGHTVWGGLLTKRDYGGDSLVDVLKGSRGEKAAGDLAKRLVLAAEQRDQVESFGLIDDPNTLFVVNTFGRLDDTARVAANFVHHGKITNQPFGSPSPTAIRAHLGSVEDIAREALASAA